jgi:EmrB/QacA subfamily drug resistance transporter
MDDRQQRNIALLVAGTFFMEILDGTILSTAAPSIGLAFSVPSAAVGVTITAYLLTLAALIPLSGWIARRFGARRVFLAAIAIFVVASVLCAASTSLAELSLMRVAQGVGGAMMVPVGRLAVLRVTDKSALIRTLSLLTWPALAAPVIAPLLGGVITTYTSWHWIFLVNVPLGVIAFAAAWRLLPRQPGAVPPRLDWLGLLLTGTGLAALVSAGSLVSAETASTLPAAVLAATGLALCGAAVLHFRRARHPLLDLGAMRNETFRLSQSSGFVFRMTVGAVPFLLPLLFQDAFGWSPVRSGALVLILFVGNLAIKAVTTALLQRFGFRAVLIAATLGASVSMALAAFLSAATPLPLVVALLLFSGAVRSLGFTAYNTIAFAEIGADAMTDANTLASTLQQVAAGFGIALGAVALRGGDLLVAGAGSGAATPGAFRFGFLVLAALTLASTLGALRASPNAGDHLRRHPNPRPAQ